MTTTPATRPKLVAPDGETPVAPLNLYQKLAAISAEVQVKATGKTAFDKGSNPAPVISITDAERALGDLLAKHGVVTGYFWNRSPEQVGTLWEAALTVWLVNADDPNDKREDAVFDVGNSPSAAVSFAIKRYYRALFHLADEEDEKRSTPVPQRVAPPTPPQAPVPAGPPLTEQQKKLLTSLGNTLTHPWEKDRYAQEIGKRGFLGTREFLLSAHRTQHGEGCPHFAEAVAALGDEAAAPLPGQLVPPEKK